MTEPLDPGTLAPNFQARDQNAKPVRLSDQRGHWVVLFFYPKDRTPNCTKEACGFRDNLTLFRGEDAVILGVSRDDLESHEDFARRRRLSYSLLSDTEGQITRAYHAQGWFGRPRRLTYIIDPGGIIARVYPHVRSRTHANTVLADLRSLKLEQARGPRMRSAVPI